MEQSSKKKQNAVLGFVADAMSTHPPSKERVKQMNEMARQTKASQRSVINTKAFDQMKKIAKKYTVAAQRRAKKS